VIPSLAREGFDDFSTGPTMDVPRQWPFADPQNLAVITVVQVLRHGMPVLYVTHDADDGGWQFLTGEAADVADAMVVSLQEMVRHDPSLAALADLPIGWCAWRERKEADWLRRPRPPHQGSKQS